MSEKLINYDIASGSSGNVSDDDICIIDEIIPECYKERAPVIIESKFFEPTTKQNLKRPFVESSDESDADIEIQNKHLEKNVLFTIDTKGESSCVEGFYSCEVCDITLRTDDLYQMHLNDKKHKKAVSKLEATVQRRCLEGKHGDVSNKLSKAISRKYPAVPLGVIRRKIKDESLIQSLVQRDFPPCAGLEHVIEIRSLKETSYFCEFCEILCERSDILLHLKGWEHQKNCLKSLRSDMYEELHYLPKYERKKTLLRMLSYIQEKEGRGKIVVEKDYLNDSEAKNDACLQTLVAPGTSSDKSSVAFYQDTEYFPVLSDLSKIDYFCVICECYMYDNNMWESHAKGNEFMSKVKKYPKNMVSETIKAIHVLKAEAFLIDRVIDYDDPIVGLDYIREMQHYEAKKETYHCFLCGDCLTCIDIVHHITTQTHRVNYLEHIDHHSLDVVRGLNLKGNKSYFIIEEICRKIQKEIGSGCPDVYVIKDSKNC